MMAGKRQRFPVLQTLELIESDCNESANDFDSDDGDGENERAVIDTEYDDCGPDIDSVTGGHEPEGCEFSSSTRASSSTCCQPTSTDIHKDSDKNEMSDNNYSCDEEENILSDNVDSGEDDASGIDGDWQMSFICTIVEASRYTHYEKVPWYYLSNGDSKETVCYYVLGR